MKEYASLESVHTESSKFGGGLKQDPQFLWTHFNDVDNSIPQSLYFTELPLNN